MGARSAPQPRPARLSEAKLSLLSRTRSESEQTLFDISAYWPVDIITSAEIHMLLGDERPTNAALRHAYDRAGLMRVKKWKAHLNFEWVTEPGV